jgi:DNA-binding transcriptional regulator YiaG
MTGNDLRQAREAATMTLEEFADWCGVTPSQIQSWESYGSCELPVGESVIRAVSRVERPIA